MDANKKPNRRSETEKLTNSLGWGLLDSKKNTNPIKNIISPRVKIIVKHSTDQK